ncbi:tungstate transport system permease protein [Azospirillum fermentarium]|uniref:ABC transporter permease n=1 Tax=Azospirillum fermentarium TaxID=1233114 RepID=UPI00222742FC|nr:ABC transporter permease [Azospirillum fermentarium]MCW2246801.1 tungstate transport system permease protein [Azospirillum fermentarium]
MDDLWAAFRAAAALVTSANPDFLSIVGLSLRVTLQAVTVAAVVGMPLGALLAVTRFPGRGIVVVIFNALMGLPPVVAGLLVYLMLSRAGPLGPLGMLFTPGAMVVAQTVLVLPIVLSLTRQVVEGLWEEYADHLRSLGATKRQAVPTLLWDGRYALLTALLAGFGRASAEVGAVLIVGGNIAGLTRTMTTAISLETGKGNLPLALGLGVVLLGLTLVINAAAYAVGHAARRWAGA